MSLFKRIGQHIHEAVAHGHFRDAAIEAAQTALVVAKPAIAAKIARVANRHGIPVPESVIEEIVDTIIEQDEDDAVAERTATDE